MQRRVLLFPSSRGVFAPRPVGGGPASRWCPPAVPLRCCLVRHPCYSPVLAGVVTQPGEIFVLDPCRRARLRLPRSRRLGAAISQCFQLRRASARPFFKSPSVSLWKVAYAGSFRLLSQLHTDPALAHRRGCAGLDPSIPNKDLRHGTHPPHRTGASGAPTFVPIVTSTG
jgi:hypothetical protein